MAQRARSIFDFDHSAFGKRVDLIASVDKTYNRLDSSKDEKDFVYFIAYGAMLHPPSTFKRRIGFLLSQQNLPYKEVDDIWQYHVGVYTCDRKLLFNKKSGNGQNCFASLGFPQYEGEQTICSVYAIPKQALAPGSAIMSSEMCVNYDYTDPRNEYILIPNSFTLINVDNNHKINPYEAYVFVASQYAIEQNASLRRPEPLYLEGIIESLKLLADEGFRITEPYIATMENLLNI